VERRPEIGHEARHRRLDDGVGIDEWRCRPPGGPSYPPQVATTSDPLVRPTPDPDGGSGDVHELLVAAVEEAARLLEADGAMVYLIDEATGHLRFAHDAGIRDAASRRLVRTIDLPVGVGMFGRAVAERSVVLTRDYPEDHSFPHTADADQVVRDVGIRSMVVAPLLAGDVVFGAIGTYSPRHDAFSDADIALVRALADHAAAAMANARLIEDLDASRRELAERADVERSVRQIAARISAATDLSAVLQLAVDEAARLLRAEGARIDMIDEASGLLSLAYASGGGRPDDDPLPDDPEETADQGVSGQAVLTGRPYWTGDYLADDRFPHGRGADEYLGLAGIRSVMAAPMTGEGGPIGTLSVLASRSDAWAESDSQVLAAIADQAAITIRTTRLIDETDRARETQVRRAEAEQALREVGARITAMRETDEILRDVVRLAGRLVRADGVILDLLDPSTGNLHWAMDDGLSRDFGADERAALWISVGVGATGVALAEDRVIIGDDDLASLFPPSPESTEFYERTGFRSMIAAPITGDKGPLGVLEVYSRQPAAFGQTDAGFVGALAGQAAIAITNARLIDELDRSRQALARAADSERTLREIAARVSAILEPDEVLQRIVDETTRLLASDGARIDLYEPETDTLRWSFAAGDAMARIPAWAISGGLRPGQAVAGTAFTAGRPVRTDDYLEDDRFDHGDDAQAFVVEAGIRSVIAVPLAADTVATGQSDVPLGTLSVVSRQVAAYDDADEGILAALAIQAAIAIRNARLIEALASSRAVIERRADAEQTLREIATRITAIRRPDDLLQRIVDEAQRLLRADGAVIDEFDADAGVLVAAYDAGLTDDQRDSVRSTRLHIGEGLSGKAMAEGRVVSAGDYLEGDFTHIPSTDAMAARTGIGDLIVAPIIGDQGPLGAIEVYRRTRHSFDDIDAAVIGGLADQAAIAITNARLIDELERSQAAVARRAETERALREISAGIAALHDPDAILDRVVGEARRLLATDGAHLTRMSDDRTYLIPVIATDGADPETRAWLLGMQFPLGGGINGLAAEQDQAVWTGDYEQDPRVPHEGSDDEVARLLGLRGMAAAPLRAPGGEVIGTLAISSATPRDFDLEELDLLQGLADQAAIAITNSTLLTRLSESEARYRFLIENAPDVVFSTQADGRYTFVSDAIERLTGHRPDDVVGKPFGWLFHESSQVVAGPDWSAGLSAEASEIRGRVDLRATDGSPVPAEFIASARFDGGGRFMGTNGSVRDMRERDRLEDELRASEVRFRTLAASSPDLVFETDAEGHWTFLSDRTTDMLGWSIEQTIGQHFSGYIAPGYEDLAAARYADLAESPDDVLTVHLHFKAADGRSVPLEINIVGSMKDGRLAAIHGVARDVSERDRLERDLRRQAAELAAGEERAHLARELHDSVTQALFSMTLVSRSIEMLLDRDVEAARTQLAQLRDLQREALAEMRALIFELRPGNLEQDGLDRALRTHAAALQGRIGLPITVESTLDERLPLAVEEVLYRIAQEALHNVVKHANARQVRVELGRITGAIRLRVSDDGRGFDPAQVGDGHLGLAGMQARAEKIEARFTVTSVTGQGTAVEVVVPNKVIEAAAVAPAPPTRDSIRDE
jgi:PAS domain S-box-containing protein